MPKNPQSSKRSKKWYSEELNRMYGFSGEQQVDWAKLSPEDLTFLYFHKKTEVETKSSTALNKGGMLDGSIAKQVLGQLDIEDLERLKNKFPIAADIAEIVLKKRQEKDEKK